MFNEEYNEAVEEDDEEDLERTKENLWNQFLGSGGMNKKKIEDYCASLGYDDLALQMRNYLRNEEV